MRATYPGVHSSINPQHSHLAMYSCSSSASSFTAGTVNVNFDKLSTISAMSSRGGAFRRCCSLKLCDFTKLFFGRTNVQTGLMGIISTCAVPMMLQRDGDANFNGLSGDASASPERRDLKVAISPFLTIHCETKRPTTMSRFINLPLA